MNDTLTRLAVTESMFAGRWSYWLCCQLNRRLLDEPWKVLDFADQPTSSPDIPDAVPGHIAKLIGTPVAFGNKLKRILERSGTYGGGHDDLARYWLHRFGDPAYPDAPKLNPAVLELVQDDSLIGGFLAYPADWAAWVLGQVWYINRGSAAAWFPTPMSVVKLMMAMTEAGADPLASRLETFYEPCCGTGGIVLVASNHYLGLHASDIDPAMVAWTRFQCYMYAPWAVVGSRRAVRELRDYDDAQPRRAASVQLTTAPLTVPTSNPFPRRTLSRATP